MKASKLIKVSLVSLLVVGLVAYIIYAMIFLSGVDEEERCVAVELIVKQDEKAMFVDEKDIEELLKNAHVYPKGMLMKDVDTKQVEEVVKSNEFIAEVECYKSAGGKLCVKATQRVPVIFVVPEGKDGYFVDAHGKQIPHRNNVSNLVVASGNIDDKFACTKLAEFGHFLQTDDFWNNQIEQVYVMKNKKGEPVVELIPRVGSHIVCLGAMDDYQKKLRKLRVFYDKAVGTVGWNKYARVNLEYGNQIICTKKK